MTTKIGRKRLFQMTLKRKLIMEGIITIVNGKADNVGEDGFARLLAQEASHFTQEERQEKLAKLDAELLKFNLYHDVLELVMNHEHDLNLKFLLKEKRDWRNEWEIPLDIFNESIDGVIGILRWYQERGIGNKYEEQISFLQLVKEFRNKE